MCFIIISVPPTFQVQPRDTNVTQGYPLTLHCQATGFPLPILTWQKDGQPVDTNHVTLLSNGSLHISSTAVQDAGKFSCIATNVAGSATVTADVVIYGRCTCTMKYKLNSYMDILGLGFTSNIVIEIRVCQKGKSPYRCHKLQ